MAKDTAKGLLAHLWRGGAWAYWWTPDGPEYTAKSGELVRSKLTQWFPVNSWAAIPAFWQDKNIYFGVHPCTCIQQAHANGKPAKQSAVRGRIEHIAAINAVFGEFDVKDYGNKPVIMAHLDTLPLYPTAIIDSGGGLHCYWLIEYTQPVTDDNRTHMQHLQAAWVEIVGGDKGAKDLARVLRLPGFTNRKPAYAPDFPTVDIVEFTPKRIFPFEYIHEITAARIEKLAAAERLRQEQEQARTGEPAPGAADQLLGWAVRHAKEGERHKISLWLAGRLKAEGLTAWAASSVMKEFARQVSKPGSAVDEGEIAGVVRYIWGGA